MLIILTLIVLLIDFISKVFVSSYLPLDNSITVISGFFDLTYVKNTGIAWSLFDKSELFVIIASGLIILALASYMFKDNPSKLSMKIAYAFILGGALGNFINRIFYGYVIDFLDFKIFGYNYPIFNLADIFIVVGGIILVLSTWRDTDGNKGRR